MSQKPILPQQTLVRDLFFHKTKISQRPILSTEEFESDTYFSTNEFESETYFSTTEFEPETYVSTKQF